MRKAIILAVVLLLLCGSILAGCAGSPDDEADSGCGSCDCGCNTDEDTEEDVDTNEANVGT